MDKAQSDLVLWYKLETEFFQDHVRHTRYVEGARNRNKKVREDWRNSGELGKGGFGIVHKQIKATTGHYRAVKTIEKRLPRKFDYSRELLIMAILAKHPSLFVEFLGWFEEPETLYITMEYLEKGDLTKHVDTPLSQETVRNISKQILEGLEVMHQHGMAHRDLKPANIFVVSMSPVWVKLGDFGISKRIQAQDTTTFHTQVLTPEYGAPEVLGLDSSRETSDYTNSVDIWSLGCVVYELLVGAKLFVSLHQVNCYYLGISHFPEDKLKQLSSPTSDVGILFLKSMLTIQPEDRPTAAGALRHAWLTGVKCDNTDSGGSEDGIIQSLDESTWGRKSKNKLAVQHKLKKRRSQRTLIPQDNTKYSSEDVVLKENTETQKDPELLPHNSQATRLKGARGPKALGEKRVRDIPQTRPQDTPQAIPQRQNFAIEIVSNRTGGRIASLNTTQDPNPPPSPLMKPLPQLPASQPSRAGSGQTVRKPCRTKPSIILAPIHAVGGAAEAKTTQLSVRYKLLILVGILVRAGILSETLILAGGSSPVEVETSDETPFPDGTDQTEKTIPATEEGYF